MYSSSNKTINDHCQLMHLILCGHVCVCPFTMEVVSSAKLKLMESGESYILTFITSVSLKGH